MGGQNHQPCSSYLGSSTKLSRSLSLAYAHLELGNVALEDVLLAEFANERSPIQAILDQLELSDDALVASLSNCKELRDLMDALSYQDLPALRELDLVSLGEQLSSMGMLQQKSWTRICQIMAEGGFYKVLDYFEERIAGLRAKSATLVQQIQLLEEPAELGEVNLVLEENRRGNIRPAFGELYTFWGSFHQDFLASSLLSTELWYTHDSRQSLVASVAVQVRS